MPAPPVVLSAALRAACAQAVRSIVVDGIDTAVAARAVVARAANNDERLAVKDAIYQAAIFRDRNRARCGDNIDAWFDVDHSNAAALDTGDVGGDDVDGIAARRGCPRFVVERLMASLGARAADAFLAHSNRPGPLTVRANTLVTTRDALREELRACGLAVDDDPHSPWALTVHTRAPLLRTAAWRRGAFEVQDAASQLVVVAADVHAGDVVVDLCAGRGGKTLALAAAMNDEGVLIAEDVDDDALAVLRGRASRLGLRCVRVRSAVAEGSADVVVVDAPCTSLGVLRRSPDLRHRLTAATLAALAPVQRAVLRRGLALAKPGGRIVYATCSVLREENEDVVDDVAADGALIVERALTVGPHREGCDGFFIATARKARQ